MPRTDYCHNCRYVATLPDGTFCGYCLTFFYDNSRLPTPSDASPRQSTATDPSPTIARLWAEIDNRR